VSTGATFFWQRQAITVNASPESVLPRVLRVAHEAPGTQPSGKLCSAQGCR
jgi:hypothetical protein